MMKRHTSALLRVVYVFACAMVATSLHAQSDAQDKLNALFGDELIAKGDGFTVSRAALDESIVTIRASAAGRGGADFSPARMEQLEREVTRRLINIALLLKLATDEDREAGVVRANERIEALIERAGSETAMARQLKAVGMTMDRLRVKFIEEATAQVVLERELGVEITDEQVQAYYDENQELFEKPEAVRAAHILRRTRDLRTGRELSDAEKTRQLETLESLLERARKGADFAKLAEEYSEDPVSSGEGGEYTFARGQMFPAFEAVAFSLSPGQISDVVTSQYGYHIVKVYEKIPASKVELDEKVTEDVRAVLAGKELEARMQPYMEELMRKANVEILVERLKLQEGDELAP